MNTSVISLLVSLTSLHASAVIAPTDMLARGGAPTCSVRMSNGALSEAGSDQSQHGYCSGTMIDSKTLVMAAHCLAEMSVSTDRLDPVTGGSFNLALDRSDHPTQVQLASVQGYTGPSMSTKDARETYAGMKKVSGPRVQANQAKLNDDLTIVKLQTPVAGAANCPRLPTKADCSQFQAEVLSNKSNPLKLSANYFLSSKVKQTSQMTEVGKPVPQSAIYAATATSVTANASGWLSVAFQPASSAVIQARANEEAKGNAEKAAKLVKKYSDMHLVNGDSGSGLIWDSGHGDVMIGVQSGAFLNAKKSDTTNAGAFASMCAHIDEPQWAAVAGSKGTQSAEQNVTTPGQPRKSLN